MEEVFKILGPIICGYESVEGDWSKDSCPIEKIAKDAHSTACEHPSGLSVCAFKIGLIEKVLVKLFNKLAFSSH